MITNRYIYVQYSAAFKCFCCIYRTYPDFYTVLRYQYTMIRPFTDQKVGYDTILSMNYLNTFRINIHIVLGKIDTHDGS